MTSNLSSAKLFRTSFVQTLKKYSFYSVLLFALLCPLLGDIGSMYRQRELYLTGLNDYDHLKDYIFALNRYMGTSEMGYFCLALGLTAMFLALHCWRFLHVKKTVNVYFSLGLTRSNLFLSRFFACCTLLVLPVVLVFAVLTAGNLILFDSCPQLWQAAAIYALSFIVIALFAFAVTTLSMSVTGASVESFLCAGCLIAMPVTVFYAVKYFSLIFLNGAPYDYWIHDILTEDAISNGGFAVGAEFLNFFYPVSDYAFSSGFKWYVTDGWHNPGWGYALTYLAATVVVTGIAFVCFVRRKNENAGFLGKNPALIGVACLSLSYLLVFPAYFLVSDAQANAFIIFIALIILFLVYTLIMAILLRSRKKLLRAMPVAFAVCAVFALSCGCFVSGGFGYETRIPDREDIVSVSVSGGFSPAIYEGGASTFSERYYDGWYTEEEPFSPEHFVASHLEYYYANSAGVLSGLTDEKDIDTVLQIHQLLIEAEEDEYCAFGCPVALQYVLQDGSTVTRYYKNATNEVMELIRPYEQHEDTVVAIEKMIKDQWIDTVTLLSPAASQVTLLPQTMMEDGFSEQLIEALVADLYSGTLRLNQFEQTAAPIGYIGLSSNLILYEDQYYYGDTDYYYDEYGVYDDETVVVTALYESADIMPVFDEPTAYSLGKIYKEYDYFDVYNLYPVYADMKATVAVLTQYDVLQYFAVANVPVRAKLMHNPFTGTETQAEMKNPWYLHYRSSYFFGSYSNPDNISLVEVCQEGALTNDTAVLEQLVKDSFLRYPVTQDGYFAAFEYADGTSVLTYIPAENVPEQLR